jgi:asparagine synthase (glutamine-hydrolysing)
MCGICGSLALDGATVDAAELRPMLAAMVHRGPDAEGLLEEPGVAAGIRRLAVIDIDGGSQPLASEDGAVRVVFNGEIYNYRDLTRELIAKGHRFRTRSDTEVLVHLWEEHGPEMVHRLNGMFAFFLHDRRSGKSFLARDRLGIKPLFYWRDGSRIVFASEQAVLLRHPAVPSDPDQAALIELYRLQYVSGERTIYRGVRKLLPGHAMRIDNGEVRVYRYYDLPAAGSEEAGDGDARPERLRELMESSVRHRRISDVPLGMFLSGGIDSSVVVGLLAGMVDHPVKTFSVGFEGEAAFDERRFAALVAGHYRTDHHELLLSPMAIAEQLPRIIDQLAEPVMDPALIPTRLLSEFARREVTVVLTGEGADELFGGYRRYLYQKRYGRFAAVPGLLAAGRGALGRWLPRRAGQALDALSRREPVANHLEWSSVVGRDVAAKLFDRDAWVAHEREAAAAFSPYFRDGRIRLGDQLRADQHEWLPHNLLAKVDRASMAFSLEARVPFLDHRVVEWAALLPDSEKILGGETKVILRRAFRESVPPKVLERPKQGFDLPLAAWIRGPLRSLARDLLAPRTLRRWEALRTDGVGEMLRLHLDGAQDFGLPLFNLLSIMLFLERRGPA